MGLTVVSVAYPFAPVAPETAGGAEQVLRALDCALVEAGHRSLVLAARGSRVAGELIAVPLEPVLDDAAKVRGRDRMQAALDAVLARERVDVIHMHGMDFADYRLPMSVPVLVTLHLPAAWMPPAMWARLPPNVHLCCVSATQRLGLPAGVSAWAVVENGVELPPSLARTGAERFAVAMGRVCPEKNQAAALRAASAAGIAAVLAGAVFPYREHEEYMEREVRPLLRGAHRWVGVLQPAERQALVREAVCLLHPTLAPETSSLVAMEALAVGTPVVAYRSGALPEIVDDGVTGFLVDDEAEMAEALARVHELSRERCRATAERRFDARRMCREYLQLYEELRLG